MAKRFTKKEAVSIAISAARLYRDNFVGKRLLFLLTDKHKRVTSLEVGFDASNFQHLMGLKSSNTNWSHLDFYNFCIDGRLKESHIEFADQGTTNQKLSVLPHVFKNASLSASMMGTYNNSHPLLYTERLVGGTKWALGFRDVSGFGDYVPDTLLEGDIRNNIREAYRIIATYVKNTDEDCFSQLVYRARKIEYERLIYPQDWGNRPVLVPEVQESTETAPEQVPEVQELAETSIEQVNSETSN